jgi:hypothetical protein
LTARFEVNGIQKAARSLGISARRAAADMRVSSVISILNNAASAHRCPVAALFVAF